ncbi:VWA domain-containing protein [Parafannyhessea umbonata]|nr:VWA domain-containing protein [Parafannyhessea umbonata]
MMIKRSNRGKLSGSLGGRALPDMRKGTQCKWRYPLPYALILVLGLVLSLGMVPATAEAEISGPPAHEKKADMNADGTVDVTLNVTGAVDQSSDSSKSDVIVVLDLSGSMNQVPSPDKNNTYYTNEYYLNGGRRKVKYYEAGWHKIDYIWKYFDKAGWYYTDDSKPYEGSDFYPTTTNETTRLDTAKSAVKSLVKELLANNESHSDSVNVSLVTFSDVATVKVGLTNNETTIDNAVDGLTADGGTNWEDALETAAGITTREGASASVVFVSDGDPTFRATAGNKSDNTNGDQDKNTGKYYYGEGNGDSLNQNYYYAKLQAQAIVKKKGWEFYSVAAFGNVNNMQKLVTDSGEQTKDHFFKASDSSSLNAAFESIVKSITTTVSYTDVSIHDSLSDSVKYVLPSGAEEPTFTYKKNEKPWTPETSDKLAKLVNGAVVWSVGDLDPDTTYSVTFKVRLTQDAYDAAAPKDGEEVVSDVKTNSGDASKDFVEYKIKTDVDGTTTTSESQQSKYDSPTVAVPKSILHVSKTWETNGWGNVNPPSKLQVKVKQDGEDYTTVTLDASNNWSTDVFVAAGPKGHKYTVEEVNAPVDWDAKLPDGVTLKGLTSLTRDQAITNTIKTAKLTITKSVTGNFGDTSKDFSFTLADAFGNAITNVKAIDGTSDGVSLGNNGDFTLKNDEKLVVELPYGASYKVVEHDPKGTNDTVDYITTIDVGESGAITDNNTRTASSPEGGITQDTTIKYTNSRHVTPDVGVDLGSGASYAAVCGGVGIAGVIWMVLKRRNRLGI